MKRHNNQTNKNVEQDAAGNPLDAQQLRFMIFRTFNPFVGLALPLADSRA